MPREKTTVQGEPTDAFSNGMSVVENMYSATQSYISGMSRYTTDFFIPYFLSSQYFTRVEEKRLGENSPTDNLEDYLKLLQNNIELMDRSTKGIFNMMMAYAQLELNGFMEALEESFFELKYDKLAKYTKHQAELLSMVSNTYPDKIEAIHSEFGFHFESGKHLLVDETDRFLLYRVTPSIPQVKMRADAKPVLILPPFVLGTNILGFLPEAQRSYAHSFANQGFPTYIRVLKDIQATPALQVMNGEDDAMDTRRFCQAIMKEHGKHVTLNGYCQGGYSALCNLLSGKLDGLVDALITCVSPIDGTRSKGLARFLNALPDRFNDLAYGTKILANGNRVTDGKLMGWVYKLKSIEHEIPAAAFFRDLAMFARQKSDDFKVSKSAAALNYWLRHERSDLPLAITQMSFASYTTPITDDGTLPVRLFGRKLNLKRLEEKNTPWLICYGIDDDLVEQETALAPTDFIDVEVTPFPKGHVAIATSWSSPDSECALHTRFGKGNHRGPVRFHMDLEDAQNESVKDTPAKTQQSRKTAVQPKARSGRQVAAKKTAASPKPAVSKTPAKTAGKATTAKRVTPKTPATESKAQKTNSGSTASAPARKNPAAKAATTAKTSSTAKAKTVAGRKPTAKAKTPTQTKQADEAKVVTSAQSTATTQAGTKANTANRKPTKKP